MKDIIEKYFNLFSVVFIVLLVLGFWVVKHQGQKITENTSSRGQ